VEEMPKPWRHSINIVVDWETLGGEQPEHAMIRRSILAAKCTCGDYEQKYEPGADPLDIAVDARPHMNKHPLEPQSMCQLGNGDVALVFAVPGLGEEKNVHMTITVTEDVWKDSARLAEHIGMIGSPEHFQAEENRRAAEAHGGRHFHAIPVDASQIQGLLEHLRAQAGDAGVAFFQRDEEQKKEEEGS